MYDVYKDRYTCPHCAGEFRSKKSLTVHLDNPPKYCEKRRSSQHIEFIDTKPNQVGSTDYLKDSLFSRYLKEAHKEVDGDGKSNIMLFHLDQDLDVSALNDMIRQCRKQKAVFDASAETDSRIVNSNISSYQSKYGVRAEETEFLNNSNNCHYLELSKLRELYMLKIGIIDVLMIKSQPDYICLSELEKMFGRDLIVKLSIEYGTK